MNVADRIYLTTVHAHTKARNYSVIEGNEKHPEESAWMKKVEHEFADVLFQQTLAKDVPGAFRGPFGIAHIELKSEAVPQKSKPFRLMGEKKIALKLLVNKCLANQWIEPSSSEWGSQAFLAPNPDMKGP